MDLFRLVFILQSYLLLIFIYLLNHSITIGTIFKDLEIVSDQVALPDLPNLMSYTVYLLIVWVTSKLMLLWVPSLKDSIEVKSENIDKIYPASESFLPTFFAYVFLGLSINNWTSLFFVLAKLLHKKTILHFHPSNEKFLYEPNNQKLYRNLFSKANLVLVLSEQWRRWIKDSLGLTKYIEVLYNPCTIVKKVLYLRKNDKRTICLIKF